MRPRHFRANAPKNKQVGMAALRAWILTRGQWIVGNAPVRRSPNLRVGKINAGRQDADDGVWLAVYARRLTERVGTSAEALSPQPRADDRDARRTRALVLGSERATEQRLDSEDVEEAGTDHRTREQLGMVI